MFGRLQHLYVLSPNAQFLFNSSVAMNILSLLSQVPKPECHNIKLYRPYRIPFHQSTAPHWARASSLLRFLDHIQTHHSWQNSPGRVISPTKRTQERHRFPCVLLGFPVSFLVSACLLGFPVPKSKC